jgi:DNA-directed RNA polymerase subunit alpha
MSNLTHAAELAVKTGAHSDPAVVFNLRSDPIPSFAALEQFRSDSFHSAAAVRRLSEVVDSLQSSGEEGRRKGLGCWMLGRYEEAVRHLGQHGSDDVASFTCAHALMALRRYMEAAGIFRRLSDAYPNEPRPRGGLLEAELENDLVKGDLERAVENLKNAIAAAPASFADSGEASYLRGRLAELEGDWSEALDRYETARERTPHHRQLLFRAAYLAERCGLDEHALDLYQSLASMLPIDRNVMMNLGILYEDLGRDQEATACYDTVLRTFPTDRRARLYFQDAHSAINMYYDEELERKEDRLNQILRTPITDFELSVRARNCLNKMNILTLGDLVRLTEQELLSYKNFGETSLQEIKEILLSKGLRLGMGHAEAVASIEAATHSLGGGENSDVLNRPIAELDLSIRARRTVENVGCLTIGDILQHTEEELLGMPNFGQTSLQELKRKLGELGLKLNRRSV